MSTTYSFLTMISGPRSGTNYLLDAEHGNQLGRGMDCDIVLADPLCSRVHAELLHDEEGWWLCDKGSRNGTFVNEKRVNGNILLQSGGRLRIGSTEFTFLCSDQSPTLAQTRDNHVTESIVREAPLDTDDSRHVALKALRHADNAHDLLVLFRLSVDLLQCDDPNDVLRKTLELIHDRTQAAVVGFLWVTEDGMLKPQMMVPAEAAEDVSLSQSLTRIVIEQRSAVWVANQTSQMHAESLRQYADAMCVPVIRDKKTIGAIHTYLGQGNFRDIDFDFAISVSQVLAVALARSRRQATLAADHQRLVASSAAADDLIGESDVLVKLKAQIVRVAQATGCVLVRGESGSGKELVAQAIHKSSPRNDRPLLAVNCAAIPSNLVESQLFGHKKGAFTGATNDREGWFKQAHTGTLFLDEIGELSLDAQAKLLRILENHPFLPVGATEEISVDVRVIAATNRDLRELVRERTFREDLYYRLSVFELYVPPLRDREGDIDLLLEHFLDHFAARHGRPQLTLSAAARQKLLNYPWPGNVRQMRNVVDSAVVMAPSDTIHVEDLGLYDAGTEDLDSLKISDWERKLIKLALQRTSGNVPDAAKLLGIGRATLYRKIDEYKIERS